MGKPIFLCRAADSSRTKTVLIHADPLISYRPAGSWPGLRFTPLELVMFAVALALLAALLRQFLSSRAGGRKYRFGWGEGEKHFQMLADAIPFLIWTSGPNGRVTHINRTGMGFAACDPSRGFGDEWAGLIHADDLPSFHLAKAQAIERGAGFSIEYRLRRPDGECRWMLDVAAPRTNKDGSFAGLIGATSDITDQKLAQEALRNLSGRLIEAQEKERTRIARELHDDICQKLAVLSMELEMSKRECHAPDGDVETRIEGMRKRCAGIAADVQALSHELHSSRLDYLGLTVALQSFCQEFAQQQNVNVDFIHEDVADPLPKDVALTLFRVAQEGLRNSLKYSGVDRFSVRLRGLDNRILLEVSDQGNGFDMEAAKRSPGLGLISMQERAHLVSGTFAIQSRAGGGTRILVDVPLPSADRVEQARASQAVGSHLDQEAWLKP
jgi:PAS domain S-box-containing protein